MKCLSNGVFQLEAGVHRVTLTGAPDSADHFFCALSLLGGETAAVYRSGSSRQLNLLCRDGDICVVEARETVDLLVAIVASSRASAARAAVNIERIGALPAAALANGARAAPPPDSDMYVVAHLERRGDVRFNAGAWVGTPAAPGRIEALGVVWPSCPPDLTLTYRARFVNGVRTGWLPLGSFVGTRGRALAITALELALSGPAAGEWQIEAEAAFKSGRTVAPPQAESGRTIVLTGTTGHEPLVGLRLSIKPVPDRTASDERRDAAARMPGRTVPIAPERASVPAEVPPPAPEPSPSPITISKLQRVKLFRSPTTS
jgi:hypothetical protein